VIGFPRGSSNALHVSREKMGNCGSFRPDGKARRSCAGQLLRCCAQGWVEDWRGSAKRRCPPVKNRDPLIFRRAFDMACSSEIFWTALSERRGGLELSRGRSQRRDSFGHEPALVARCRSPAKLLLGFPKFVGIPRCNDYRRCHSCCWHSQGGPATLASCRTSEQLRRLEGSYQPLPRIDVRFSPSFLTIRHA
jgi:hypothetical protein